MIRMFEPFRCETCHYGRPDLLNNCWVCLAGIEDEEECEENYEDAISS